MSLLQKTEPTLASLNLSAIFTGYQREKIFRNTREPSWDVLKAEAQQPREMLHYSMGQG